MAQRNRKEHLNSERLFINQFAQARNMIQKVTSRSNVERYRNKLQEDTTSRVNEFRAKSQGRREFVQSVLYEKFKAKRQN